MIDRATNRTTAPRKRCFRGRVWGAVASLLGCALLLAPVQAQNDPVPGSPGTNGQPQITTATYTVAVDDVLNVTVLGQPEFNRSLTTNVDGTVEYPIIGTIKVVGKTLQELDDIITKGLKRRFVNPVVTVSVQARPPRTMNVLGAVGNRGKIPIRDNWRIRDVIAAVGGVSGASGLTDRYEFFKASLLDGKTGQVRAIDLYKLFIENDESQNLPIKEDDTLTIAEKEPTEYQVQVLGQVKNPVAVPFPRSGSVVEVLTAVGGPTELALLSEVKIVRGDKTIPIDLRGYDKTGFQPSEKLQPGDKLIIPENEKEYHLFGRFGRGGTIPYPDDEPITLMEAISRAGGGTDGMELKKTRIVRRHPEGVTGPEWTKVTDEAGKESWTRVVNVEQMLKTGDRAQNLTLIPDDEVWVQATGTRRGIGFQELFTISAAASGLYFLIQRLF